ncbi:MAG: hypothetical protein ACE5HR_09215, partial [bacterium]
IPPSSCLSSLCKFGALKINRYLLSPRSTELPDGAVSPKPTGRFRITAPAAFLAIPVTVFLACKKSLPIRMISTLQFYPL